MRISTLAELKTISQEFLVVSCPHDRLDSVNAPKFKAEISQAIATNKPHLLMVNLQNVRYMDSSGLGCLISCLKAARATGGELVLCSVNSQVQALFELTSVDNIFKIASNALLAEVENA
jgi:anti-sigma B factor antagonist